jgi:hypothetical protein
MSVTLIRERQRWVKGRHSHSLTIEGANFASVMRDPPFGKMIWPFTKVIRCDLIEFASTRLMKYEVYGDSLRVYFCHSRDMIQFKLSFL